MSRLSEAIVEHYSLFSWQSILNLAKQRQDMNVAEGLHERYTKSKDYAHALRKHEIGVAGEYSLCRHLGKPYAAALDRTVPADVGSIYQVRSVDKHARNVKTGARRGLQALRINPADDPVQVYVLAVVDFELKNVELKGWCYGLEGKDRRWWRTDCGSAAYLTPENHLRGMASLPTEVQA
tara:strand:- start:19796 stop:20335 length:540 start_codon:yes stop_codon:yes gene_type:complete